MFLDPNDDSTIGLGPTQLLADGNPPRLMASYGLTQIALYDNMTLFRLHAPNVWNRYIRYLVNTSNINAFILTQAICIYYQARIEIPRAYVSRPEDVAGMRLWNQNPTTGLFEEESVFTVRLKIISKQSPL